MIRAPIAGMASIPVGIDNRLQIIKSHIKNYVDFPKAGVVFRDIFPILQNPVLFNDVISLMVDHVAEAFGKVDVIAGLESRGFLFGPPLSLMLNTPFVPIRKKGKLPGETIKVNFMLEYGSDVMEIQKDVIRPGQKVLIIDDLLATGGTMAAAIQLVEAVGGRVMECLVVIELIDRKGRELLKAPCHSFVQF